MIEKPYNYSVEDTRKIEQLVNDDPVQINHIVLPEGEALPEHYSNSNVYLTIVRGKMTLRLEEQEPHKYQRGNIINVPFHTRMNVSNQDTEVLEFFVVKAPHPSVYGK